MMSEQFKREFIDELINDFRTNTESGSFRSEIIRALLSKALVANLATDLRTDGLENNGAEDLDGLADKIIIQSNNIDVKEALVKAEEKINRVLNASVDSTPDGDEADDDDDEVHGTNSKFPNLKYNKPKYKNLESVLKYVETKKKPGESEGDVRIVIMNFND